MTDWVRLWHDMPTDPKWRVIARKSGRSISEVIAVFNFVMVNASANANERGRTHNLFADDIAAALDLPEADVEAILTAMKGKVLDSDGRLSGWEKRQPKREDSSAERAKKWRDERKRTQTNANERPETETDIPLSKDNGRAVAPSSDVEFWNLSKEYLRPYVKGDPGSLIGKWIKAHGKPETIGAITASQTERAVDPVAFIQAVFRRQAKKPESVWEYANGPC